MFKIQILRVLFCDVRVDMVVSNLRPGTNVLTIHIYDFLKSIYIYDIVFKEQLQLNNAAEVEIFLNKRGRWPSWEVYDFFFLGKKNIVKGAIENTIDPI